MRYLPVVGALVASVVACGSNPPPAYSNPYVGVEYNSVNNKDNSVNNKESFVSLRGYVGYEFDYTDEMSVDVQVGFTETFNRKYNNMKYVGDYVDLSLGVTYAFNDNVSLDTDVNFDFMNDGTVTTYNVDLRYTF